MQRQSSILTGRLADRNPAPSSCVKQREQAKLVKMCHISDNTRNCVVPCIWKNVFQQEWLESLKKPFPTVSAFPKLQALQGNKNIYSSRVSGGCFCLLIRLMDMNSELFKYIYNTLYMAAR